MSKDQAYAIAAFTPAIDAAPVPILAVIGNAETPQQVILTNCDPDELVARLRIALATALEMQRQIAAGVAQFGDTPPTAH